MKKTKTNKQKPIKKRTLEKPLKLNMSFEEAVKKIAKTKLSKAKQT